MPELPEVETTRLGIAPALLGRRIAGLRARERRLRYPLTPTTEQAVTGQPILNVRRRAKYLLLELETGALLVHLGMSGSLRLVASDLAPGRHDHVDLLLDAAPGQATDLCLRFHDPRRFGFWVWAPAPAETHPLLRDLGPEPLSEDFDGAYLHRRARARALAVKNFIMDSHVVVGVGNIYANESLHLAGIHPARAAGRVALARYIRLAGAIKTILGAAIAQGGTTLRDFLREDGQPGYFAQSLRVYARARAPCPTCGAAIQARRIGQRSSFFCPVCQR